MIVVCAGLVNQIDGAPVSASIARVSVRGLFGKLLNGVNGREDNHSESVVILVVANTIQEQAVLLIAKACEGIGRRSALLDIRDIYQLGLRGHNPGTQPQQFREVAAIQRQILDGFLGAEVADARAL